jgi:N-acetylmuramoyl-L-alanine amidase
MTITSTQQRRFSGGAGFLLVAALIVAAPPSAFSQEGGAASERSATFTADPSSSSVVRIPRDTAPSATQPAARSSTPARKIIVALDVGHSTADPGCISAYGRTEYAYNKDVVDRIEAKLAQSEQVKPYVVNPDGHAISLRLRTELARKHGAELFLSIHHDAAQPKYLKSWVVDGKRQFYSEDFRGYGVFVSQKNPFPVTSRSFGALLGKEMRRAGFPFSPHHNEAIKGENRPILDEDSGLYRYDDLIVLKSARMPAALLECGVIIHPEEARNLARSETQEKIAQAVTAAVEQIVSERAHTPWR